jgi:hypothetical protein
MTKQLDHAYLKELFDEHLPYEVEMMRYTYSRLESKMDQAAINVHIEAFCLHIRNLLEFLESKKMPSAGAFAAPGWKGFDGVPAAQLSAVRALLNNQISHLVANQRTTDPTKKIGGKERMQMLMLIETELERLRQGLASGWAASWKPGMVNLNSPPSATNDIVVL